MVYIHIPEALTEEEQMLMGKYAKLKKKVSSLDLFTIFYFSQVSFFLEKASPGSQEQTGTRKAANFEAAKGCSWCSRSCTKTDQVGKHQHI